MELGSHIVWSIVGLLTPSLWLLWRGCRGRRVDDHPHCARCQFDLTGLPVTSQRCPECGAGITAAGATRIGRWERRWGLILTGLALSLPAVLTLGLWGWTSARGTDLTSYKPVWWLARDARSSDGMLRQRACGELITRLKAGKLSDGQIRSLVDQVLAWQADARGWAGHWRGEDDPNGPWDQGWVKIVEAARAMGKVSDENWQRYARQSLQFQLACRDKVRRGDPLPMQIAYWTRSGAGAFEYRYQVVQEIDGQAVAVQPPNYPPGSAYFIDTVLSWWVKGNEPAIARLKEGPQATRVKLIVEVFPRNSRWKGKPLASRQLELTAAWELLPAETPSVKMNHDSSLRAAIEGGLKIERLSVMKGPRPGAAPYANLQLCGAWDWRTPPTGLACEVTLRVGEREWPLTSSSPVAFQLNSKQHGTHYGFAGGALPGFDARQVDVILRPSPEGAAKMLNMSEIWDGEIVIKDVPVTWEK